jgi:hypothetical protein
MNACPGNHASHGFHLRFRPLQAQLDDCSVPCDAQGHVDLDRLSEDLRRDYFFARTLVGRNFTRPAVELDD